MVKKIYAAVIWRINRFLKGIYYFFRIAIYPFKTIHHIQIPLDPKWAFTVKDHIIRKDYETGEYEIISSTLEKDDRVLEIGTGLGFLAIFCAKIVGQEHITSIEANPFLQNYHKKIFKLNGVYPKVFYKAVGNVEGEISFFIDRKKFWSSSLKPFKSKFLEKIRVKTLNINSIIEIVKPTYLIIDVEGFECEMMEMVTGFKTVKKIQMEVHPEVIDQESLVAMKLKLIQKGFHLNETLSDGRQYYFELI